MSTIGFYRKIAGYRMITTREAAQLCAVSIPSASMALRRLAKDGLVTPLKKGNWLVGSSASKFGAMVAAAAEPYKAYLSGWSALRIHNLIQQIPQTQFAITLGRPGKVEKPGIRISLHRMKPELFGGYDYDSSVDGFVASPEKAIFDLAYLSVMNRSRISGNLPETDLKRLKWREIQGWLRRIDSVRQRTAVKQALDAMRKQHTGTDDE
ncbi:MAG: hypothetical protein WC378_06475 [Opitutaceae bacterium]|jgi:predicted transcriptional regulator of viral defense system